MVDFDFGAEMVVPIMLRLHCLSTQRVGRFGRVLVIVLKEMLPMRFTLWTREKRTVRLTLGVPSE